MKRMMIAIAAVLVAVGVQAASVSWQITNVRIPTWDPNDPGNVAGLTITTASTQFAPGSSLVMNLYVVDSVNGGRIDLGISGSLTGAGIKASSVLWDQATAIEMRETYGVGNVVTLSLDCFYTEAATKIIDGESVAGFTNYSLTLTTSQNLVNIAGSAVVYNMAMLNQTWSASWVPIPEPTSMALLALGVAAVGLRRRFRK